jgi:flagellar export protein FliJ
MKRFRFRLEAVLALRGLAERAARERFALAERGASEALAALQAAGRDRLALVEAISAARGSCFRPAEQAAGLVALRVSERAEQEAARRQVEATAAAGLAREQWLASRRDLQVVERLQQRARSAHREAVEKSEQALLDELASLAAARLTLRPA